MHYCISGLKPYAFGLAAMLIASAGSAHADEAVKNRTVTDDARDFFVYSDPIRFAVVSGDLENGPMVTFGRFPPNFETPEHVHTHPYRAVVLKGEMTNPFEGEENPPVMKPGSYWSVAAGAAHTTACVSDTPCEFFMYNDEGFDFTPTE